MDKISIVVPVYNAEQRLECCVDSILQQTYDNYELILVDDGSTDSSVKICDAYASSYSFVHVYHIQNQGVSHARNYGIEKSTGRYITFVDADDFLTKNALEILLRGNGKLTYFSIGQYCLDSSKIEKTITKLYTKDIVLSKEKSSSDIENMDLLAVGYPYGKLFDLNIIRQYHLHFDERIKNHEDHIFCFDYLLCIDEVHVEKDVGYYWTYKYSSNSLSHITPPYLNMLIASDAFVDRYKKLWKKLPYLSQGYKNRMTAEYGIGTRRAAVYSLYHNKESKGVRRQFFKEQTKIYSSLLSEYGYHTHVSKHKFIYAFVASYIVPFCVKDYILKKLYE